MNKIDLNTITFEQIVKILGIFNKMLESGILQLDLEKSTAYLNIDDCSAYLEKQIKKLQQENKKLKKQYCERTDCSGRIGNSKKVEELQSENQQLKKQLEDKEDFINKLQATKDKLDKWNYESTMKQKEFIKVFGRYVRQ